MTLKELNKENNILDTLWERWHTSSYICNNNINFEKNKVIKFFTL